MGTAALLQYAQRSCPALCCRSLMESSCVCFLLCLSRFLHATSCLATSHLRVQMTAAVDVSAPGIDTSKEDAEIAAVWKQLEDETRRLDDIKKRLSDPEALRSEKLMISPSLILQDMPEMPAVESADSSEEEDSGLPLAKQLSRKGSAALLSRSSSAHLIEVPPESMGREVDAWNCKGPPLPPIGYAGSTKQAELAGYPKRVVPWPENASGNDMWTLQAFVSFTMMMSSLSLCMADNTYFQAARNTFAKSPAKPCCVRFRTQRLCPTLTHDHVQLTDTNSSPKNGK
eukprot:TRINITY_DN22276_c0_g1_i5.p1 TRINITY_DN22276_c0_g1~~TRINITY_DN22276_c0_g1_i5.p1  ORF type:complete len:286 (-),score=39.08 TRINITY_DN22276_c0_g1_i5:158-1015(-)